MDVYEIQRKAFGSRIRNLRMLADLSQDELAAGAGIRRALISEIESGKANPTLDTMVRIAIALDVDLAVFFERTS